jgi:hypothetical protein
LTKDREDLLDVPQVLLQCQANVEEVVHVDDDRLMPRTFSSRGPQWLCRFRTRPRRMKAFAHGGIYEPLKDRRGPLQPERHNLPHTLLEWGPKARLPPVDFADADLVVALGKVELHEPLSAASLVPKRIDVWQGFDEGLNDGIQDSIVVTNPPLPVRLPGKDNSGGITGGGELNPSTVKEVDELLAEL